MFLTDEEQKALLESTGPITERVAKTVLKVIGKLKLATVDDVEKVYRVAEKMRKAQLRASSAYANTLKSNME